MHYLKLFLSKNLFSTGSTKARRYPLSYIFSGFYYWGGYLRYQGAAGYWWAATSNESSGAYDLSMDSSSLNPSTNNHDNNLMYGLSLRFFHSSTGSTKARRYPLSYIYSGLIRWFEGSTGGQGTSGYWWTRLVYSDLKTYSLIMGETTMTSQDGYEKLYGFSLCYVMSNNHSALY
ncbi:hypothetical protein IJG78_01295 [Candidatus Saccharibacteria bacterium]|nr:hypothetical protein [Candidatus Saccharibacteria bacterium]